MASPMVSVQIVTAAKVRARNRRRVAISTSRPQLPLRRHDTAGRTRSPGPLRSESSSARIQTSASPRIPLPSERVARAVAIRFDERIAHVVAEIRRIETLEEPEPALGNVDEAIADHDFAAFESRPPRRAARVRISSRRASADATSRPASVMR